ncbi:MAG: hypothetical protein KF782_34785 [Labilithrix sp.]|nr:hypothetical protein [Labilithrix sp.]
MTHDRLDLGKGHVLELVGEELRLDGEPTTARQLTRRYPADGKVWTWLRARGVSRVSTTSGPSGSERRRRVGRSISLSPEDNARLDAIAAREKSSVSALISRWIREDEK